MQARVHESGYAGKSVLRGTIKISKMICHALSDGF